MLLRIVSSSWYIEAVSIDRAMRKPAARKATKLSHEAQNKCFDPRKVKRIYLFTGCLVVQVKV
ncbi:hypothetical protein HanIR_Chr09g0449661 [Helianthus annuus]|nr:hypothetical protein HanIR_Chr09g0449661 [Helianthus annuus]